MASNNNYQSNLPISVLLISACVSISKTNLTQIFNLHPLCVRFHAQLEKRARKNTEYYWHNKCCYTALKKKAISPETMTPNQLSLE